MGRPKKTRAAKRARPAADETCTLARTVERDGKRLAVWTCSSPSPRTPGPTGDLHAAQRVVFERIGRRKWRLFYVDPADARREDAEYTEPGWYFEAANPDPMWLNNDANGPYDGLDDARDDLRLGCSAE
jgi:hypothetical protein